MVAAGWSEAQKRAYVLADNQLAITGSGWDTELLRLELGELNLAGFDLSLTGFGDLELKDLLAERTQGLTDPDDAGSLSNYEVTACQENQKRRILTPGTQVNWAIQLYNADGGDDHEQI
jgi:hypothetical protein